ncbi:MAG: PAS domain-containing protein [Chloroflexi bacterium]|nr:PAS domain-containing protein [Chloroflexota bacterium]
MNVAAARRARAEQDQEPEGAGVGQVVAHASGAVFAVDERLRIVAWNRAAEWGLGLPEADVLGSLCYETVQAVDADTGRPCYEHCPLVHRSPLYGWVHSRVLKAQWQGGKPVQLDCMLLRCVLPSSERGILSFITPLGAAEAEGYVRAVSAIEALYPVLTRSTDLTQSLSTVVRAVLQATGADAAELRLLDLDTREPFQVVAQALDRGGEGQLARWLSSSDIVGLATRSEEAVVAFQPPEGGATSATQGMRWCLTVPL